MEVDDTVLIWRRRKRRRRRSRMRRRRWSTRWRRRWRDRCTIIDQTVDVFGMVSDPNPSIR